MKRLSRRAFLATGTSLAGTLALAGLPAFAVTPKESTSLQAQVDAGELPPINERLPENPLVITPTDRPGQQGGDWNHALVGGGSLSMVVRYQGYEPLVRYTPDWSGVEPNVAESYEVNEDGTVYTFKLRKGMKWSDGEPFTTEDIRFWYEDIFLDPDVSQPSGQTYWTTGGEKGKLEVIDEQTFSVTFVAPNGFFLQSLAWANQDQTVRAPAHYLKQFHNKYNPDVDALAKERGFESWIALFLREAGVDEDNVFFQNSQPADDQRLEVRDRARRGHRAGAGGAQPLLLEDRHRGDAAPLLRPRRLPDGRRSAGPAPEDDAGRDRHDGPVHRDPRQQAGALRQPGAGRLPLLHAEGDRGERHGLPAQPQPHRPGEERAVQQPRVPPGAVGRRRPAGADRRGLRRPGRAGAAVDRPDRPALQRAAGDAAHRVRSRRRQRDPRHAAAGEGRRGLPARQRRAGASRSSSSSTRRGPPSSTCSSW